MKQLFTLMTCLIMGSLMAQSATDTIYKKNKEVVLAKIIEIGIDEVKYSPQFNPNNLILVLDKAEIARIVFANGMVQTFANPMSDKSMYADNHNYNLKFNFFSPSGHRMHLNLERSLKPGISYELGLNLIGVGKPEGKKTPVGALLNGGMRFYRLPDMKSRSDRYSHLMNGAYFQPTMSFGRVQNRYDVYQTNYDPNLGFYSTTLIQENVKAKQDFFLFTLNFGKQMVFANRISFDVSAGFGYGTYSRQREEDYYLFLSSYNYQYESNGGQNAFEYHGSQRYGFEIGGQSFPLTGNIQFKVGYLLK